MANEIKAVEIKDVTGAGERMGLALWLNGEKQKDAKRAIEYHLRQIQEAAGRATTHHAEGYAVTEHGFMAGYLRDLTAAIEELKELAKTEQLLKHIVG